MCCSEEAAPDKTLFFSKLAEQLIHLKPHLQAKYFLFFAIIQFSGYPFEINRISVKTLPSFFDSIMISLLAAERWRIINGYRKGTI